MKAIVIADKKLNWVDNEDPDCKDNEVIIKVKSTAVNNIFDKGGSKGNSAIRLPNFVSRPSSSKAFNEYKDSSAAIKVYTGGGS